jgi:hypothetical protein
LRNENQHKGVMSLWFKVGVAVDVRKANAFIKKKK